MTTNGVLKAPCDLQVLVQSLAQSPHQTPNPPSFFFLPPSKAEAQESVEPLAPFKATNKQESGICEVPSLESMEKMPRPKSLMLSLWGGREVTPWGGNCHL